VNDHSLDTLLFLDGETFVLAGGFWVRFVAKQVPVSPERPHGLQYSLTLHDQNNERVLGFDNSHPIIEGTGPGARIRPQTQRGTHTVLRVRGCGDSAG
jgi:hypothetical protein